jgi:hypothetical protein
MKKITIPIEHKKYDISLENKFSQELEADILRDFGSNNTVKTLLSAYLNKCYEYHTLLQSINGIYDKIKKNT